MRRAALAPLAVLILILWMFLPWSACAQEAALLERPGEVEVPDLNLSDEQRNRLLALQIMLERGMSMDEADELGELWQRESGWRTDAANPNSTARGIPQAMASLYPETWEPVWMSDPRRQIEWGLDYIAQRYGSPSKALEHHDRKGWY